MKEGSMPKNKKTGDGCSYRHGLLLAGDFACADKNCYYSAAYDVILCLYKKYRITNWDDIVSIPILFAVYCNSTAVFVQAVESILLGEYCSAEFGQGDVGDPKGVLPKWAYILSTQLSYEVHLRLDSNCAASTHSRSQTTGIALPHIDVRDGSAKFVSSLNALKGIIKDLWKSLGPSLAGHKSFNQTCQRAVYTKCTKVLKQLMKLPGIGSCTGMCIIQVLSGLGVIPGECNYFAAVGDGTGSYRFFKEVVGHENNTNNKTPLQMYNDMLFDITVRAGKHFNNRPTMMMVENLACEESRKMKKYNLKYFFQILFQQEGY